MSLYKDLLAKGKEAIAAIELPFKVMKEQKTLEMKILELEQKIAKSNLTIQEQQSSCPINWDKLIDALDENALNERKLVQLRDLGNKLFNLK